ncbi:Yip1 family protein [Hymenobacter mucosus]|uniref:Yip1 domain-containing protein n=1 Tax=Hymenobacter mucosus TaxID=1411120 RepID=A0A238ZSG7_9BACT|nr:Yip1 family protein [Hymenobacter mucosus]SNR86386.1 Yip1 domain-containing protein [Hymenobacter mucosus]
MDSQKSEVQEDNLLSQIWFSPKDTLQYIIQHCPDKYVPLLLCLGGIVRAIDRASLKDMGDKMSTASIIPMAIIGGGLFGWLTYYLYAWLLSVTGKWLNGRASFSILKSVLAWSLVPSLLTLVLLVPQVALFGDELFKSEPAFQSKVYHIIWIILEFAGAGLSLWSVVILVKGISLVQGFTTGRAITNLFMPALVVVLPLIILAVLFRTF